MIDYLTPPKYLVPSTENKKESDFSALSDRDTIRKYLEDICNNLHHPVTIIDYNRVSVTDKSLDYRIDSDIEVYSLRYACKILRKCAKDEMCTMCDAFHAKCMSVNADSVEQNINNINNFLDFYYDEYVDNLPIVKKGYNRPVLEYFCPMLGYRELLFPIIYMGIVLGVLFVGQITIEEENDKERVRATKTSFFKKQINNPQNLFGDFINLYNCQNEKKINADDIVVLIMDSDQHLSQYENILNFGLCKYDKYLFHGKNFKKLENYNHFIETVCDEIGKLENKLIKDYSKKRNAHFKKMIKKIVDDYFDAIKRTNKNLSGDVVSKKELDSAWNELKNLEKEIRENFGFNNVIIFGDNSSVSIIKEQKKYAINDNFKELYYDFSVSEKIPTSLEYITSLDEPQILEGLKGLKQAVESNEGFVILYHNMAILFKSKEICQKTSISKTLAKSIGDKLTDVISYLDLCTANYLKERHTLTLRMNRHENTHISTRLNDSISNYFSYGTKSFCSLDSEKQELVIEDLKNTIKLISHTAENIGLITGSINAANIKGKARSLDVYDLLIKWQIMFRNELKDRNLDITVLKEEENDILSRLLLTDMTNSKKGPQYITTYADLFELMLFNLIDNAVKYAYIGSVIYLSWHYVNVNTCEVTVTSFGPKMDEGKELYNLYARGESSKQVVSGDGIGLYVVNRAAQLLDADIGHNCNLIADYNIPLVPWYFNQKFNDNYEKQQRKICESINASYSKTPYEIVINNHEQTKISKKDLTPEYLMGRIAKKTFATTFWIKLKL